MKCLVKPKRRLFTLVAVLTVSLVVPPSALAESPVRLQKFEGAIDLSAAGHCRSS